MWLQSLHNPLTKLGLSLVFLLGSLSPKIFSQEIQKSYSVPGIIQSLEQLVDIHRNQFIQAERDIQTNTLILSQSEDIEDIKLEPLFIRSLIFHSSKRYLNLAKGNECIFYALLENGLLKTAKGEPSNFMVTLFKKDNKTETALVSKENFFEFVYKRKCFSNKEASILFQDKNIVNTIKGFDFPIPNNQKGCSQILEGWRNNPFTPYLCRVPEALSKARKSQSLLEGLDSKEIAKFRLLNGQRRQGQFYNKNLNFFHRNYLTNLCSGIDNQKRFCSVYLAQDIWNKVVNGEEPSFLMNYKCANMLASNPKELTTQQLKSCSARYNSQPKSCILEGSKGFPSLYPHFSCDKISNALNVSHLYTDYHDCPGNQDNEGITNINRIILHLKPNNKLLSTPQTCASEANYSFAKLNLDFENEKAWPLKVCFLDKILDTEVCKSYVPGHNPNIEISESNIITQVLIRNYSAPQEMKCQTISSKKYNPKRLAYKAGCFIVYSPENCTTLHCPKKIFYNQKEIKGIEFIGSPSFDYLPTSFSNENFSMTNVLKETFKYKEKVIRNLTELTYFLENFSQSIIHGIGCAEDLIPERRKRASLNQCTPLPFLIDGFTKKSGKIKLVVRLAIEDIHSPRLMDWNFIFSAVSTYRELHPLKTWALYGIR